MEKSAAEASGEVGRLRIRDATPEDCDTIVAFNLALARETEGHELEPGRLRAGVQGLLSDPLRGRYFLAEIGGEPVGQAMVTREWSDWRNGFLWWLQSVYVARSHRRRGIYRALHAHVRERGRAEGAVGLRLYVDRENRAAQATYRALGMTESRYEMFEEPWI